MTFGSLLSTAAPLVSARSLTATEAPGQFAPSCKILYAGLVGAMETSRHKGSGVVQLRDILRGRGYTDVCAESFCPRGNLAAIAFLASFLCVQDL